ncbi:MAG: hypothetical protein Q4G19_00875 [Clostridia bacterium]|nr:hypothetical protein [Clostridia bacterium]
MKTVDHRSEHERDTEAERWADNDRDSEVYTVREETYRDGSLKNECWNTGSRRNTEEDD